MDDPGNAKTSLKSFAENYVNDSDEDLDEVKNFAEFPDTFEGFGYKFNEFGQLRHIVTGEPFEFNVKKDDNVYNQKRYEAIGELVNDYVYNLLEEEGLKRLCLPLNSEPGEPQTFIFHSDDAFTNDRVVMLIHGSGVVRAGQWARRLIINDSLNSGTQLPYIKRAKGLGYGVVVLNTNDNKREIKGVPIKIQHNDTPENHAKYVFRQLFSKTKYIAIVAHSYGGIVAIDMAKTLPNSFRDQVFALAFTDSPHSLINQGIPDYQIPLIRRTARNWVCSSKPLDTPLPAVNSKEVECVSAGTQRHDLTSWKSFASVYEFIDSKYREAVERKNNPFSYR